MKIRFTISILMIFTISFLMFGDPVDLKILFTNDTAGHPLSFSYMEESGQGGIAARATLVSKLLGGKKKKKTNTLILDAGGVVLGRPESNIFKGLPDLAGMDKIGYDAVAVGIPELWHGSDAFISLNDKANFYFLSANITYGKKKNEIADAYFVKKFGGANGIKVGVFSVITDEASKILPKDIAGDIDILDPIEMAKKTVNTLKNKEKVDIIIALTYLGYYPNDYKIGSQNLAKNVSGIDLIIDGRTALKFDQPVEENGVKIVQAFKWGLFLGEINLKIDNKKIISFDYKLHPINYKENGKLIGDSLAEDEKTLKAIKSKMNNMDFILKKRIAKLDGKFDPKNVRYEENEIGDLICDSMIAFSGADIAFQNSGGLGTEIIDTNKITRKTFDNIVKYDNSIVLVNLTGEQIIEIIKFSVSRRGFGSFLQIGGMSFTYSKSTGIVTNIKVKNQDIREDEIYRVAINSWMAQGGDGYSIFPHIPDKIDLYQLHREALYEYVEELGKIKPTIDGRINIID